MGSGTCYALKKKDYYEHCSAPTPPPRSCCTGCSGSAFCSPVSGTCYSWKNKDYYETCAVQPAAKSDTLGGLEAFVNTASETALLKVNQSAFGEEDLRANAAVGWGCCSGCSGSAFCSPVSGTCYAWKEKAYYQACSAPPRSCCTGCPGSALFTSQWDLLRVEEQGLLRNMPALSKLRGHWEVTWHSACFGPLHDRFRLMQGLLL